MKKHLLFIVFFIFCGINNQYSQETKIVALNKKAIPLKNVMTVIVTQPNCPLKVEDAITAKLPNGEEGILYKVKNTGEKKIRSYTVAKWLSDNTGNVSSGVISNKIKLLNKNDITGTMLNYSISSDQLSQDNKNVNEIKRIAFVMIVEIGFADGSKFDATATLNSLEKHLKLFELTYDEMDNAKKPNK
jgi:hypothetical protein